ncbi:uncharacterized protein [Ptychodera flava]|uniref:uncharacterized protein n=1 Tax=Ptychodera flava TaxID=63121 RepID=UPI00396A3B50
MMCRSKQTLHLILLLSSLAEILGNECSDDRPHVWLGYATSECDLTEDHCAMFGLEFVCMADYVEGDDCYRTTGQERKNVLCASPKKQLSPPSPATTLKVLAYNVWELRYLYAQQGQIERTCRIPQQIFEHHGDVDAIIWNEVFMGGCFPNDGISLRQVLNQYGFVHHTNLIGNGTRDVYKQPENGGIFISSRWPIVKEEEWIFKHTTRPSPDHLSSRGAAYAKIEKTVDSETRKYHILGTHLQAHEGDRYAEQRALQAKEMHTLMKKQNIPVDEAVIYGGDLNTDMYTSPDQWDQVLQILEADMPPIVGPLNITDDNQNNDLIHPNDTSWSKWIDYVIHSNQHLIPNNASQESIKYVDKPFEVCMRSSLPARRHTYPYEVMCQQSWYVTDLSDHYAVLGRFDFSEPTDPILNPTPIPLPAECNVGQPSVWLGRATSECNLTPEYCDMFGLKYACSAPYDIWDVCHFKTVTGQNVLCTVPEFTTWSPTPAHTFKVLAYNVWELRYLYYQSGQHERTCRVLTEIFTWHGDVDAIVFNEAFMGGCFPNNGASFRQILEYYGFVYHTETVGDDTPILPHPENGGVFISSRWPILKWEGTVYDSFVIGSEDMLSAKGAMYAGIEKTVDGVTAKYHVLGTHLQSGKRSMGGTEVRQEQVTQMRNLMLAQEIPEDQPVIYAGDFNTDYYTRYDELEVLLDILDATTPPRVGSIRYTTDHEHNDIKAPSNGTSKWIDYAMYSHAHRLPVTATQEAIKYLAPEPFTVCMEEVTLFAGHRYPYQCDKTKTITDLSDHYAVLGFFSYADEYTSEAVKMLAPIIQMVSAISFIFLHNLLFC